MAHSTLGHSPYQTLLPFFAPPAKPSRRELPPHNNTPTSKAAAVAVSRRAPNLRELVFNFIKSRGAYGATADEVGDALDAVAQTITPRIRELAQAGRIAHNRTNRPTRRDCPARVYVAVKEDAECRIR